MVRGEITKNNICFKFFRSKNFIRKSRRKITSIFRIIIYVRYYGRYYLRKVVCGRYQT